MVSSGSGVNTSAFWERFWRTSGIQFVGLCIVAYLIYGYQPAAGASSDALGAFYGGDRLRILIAAVFSGLAILNLMWFATAIRLTLADAGVDGWGAAATASSAAVGGLFILLASINTALAYSIAASGNSTFLPAMNGFFWSCFVLSAFPRAMLIMSAAFGLWRAGLISNMLFTVGVACVVLGVLGGTTWASGGFWAPDGVYSRFILPIISLAWVVVVNQVLARTPVARTGW